MVVVTSSPHHADLLETFVHPHMNVYAPSLKMSAPPDQTFEEGREKYSRDALDTLLKVFALASKLTLSAGKFALKRELYNIRLGKLPLTKEELNQLLPQPLNQSSGCTPCLP